MEFSMLDFWFIDNKIHKLKWLSLNISFKIFSSVLNKGNYKYYLFFKKLAVRQAGDENITLISLKK